MKIYGAELRRVALGALARGQGRREVAQTLGVSIPTLDRWQRAFRQQGQEAPRPRGHKRRVISPEQLPLLKGVVQAAPDSTVADHRPLRWPTIGAHGKSKAGKVSVTRPCAGRSRS